MKNSITALILILVSNVIFSQATFDKFDGQDGVTSILVNKKMFQMMSSVKVDTNDKGTQQYLELLKKLDNLRVFSTFNSKIASDMKMTADTYSETAGLEELMRVNDGEKKLRILVKSGASDSQVKELLMYSQGYYTVNETTLMSLTGNFNLNEIYILTDKMKIPGGNDLKKAANNKK